MMQARRPHNKSGKATLSLLFHNDKQLAIMWNTTVRSKLNVVAGPIVDSPCHLTKAKDGRFSIRQVKVGFAYQLAAWQRFGRDSIGCIASNKEADDVVISHVCGNGPQCANAAHLILETKRINDERTPIATSACATQSRPTGARSRMCSPWVSVVIRQSVVPCPTTPTD